MDEPLDGLAHLFGELEHELRVLGCLRSVLDHRDGLAERDDPLRGKWDRADRSQQRERRCYGDVRRPEPAREELEISDHWVSLFRSDDCDGDDGRPGLHAHLDESAASESLQLIALLPSLAD